MPGALNTRLCLSARMPNKRAGSAAPYGLCHREGAAWWGLVALAVWSVSWLLWEVEGKCDLNTREDPVSAELL